MVRFNHKAHTILQSFGIDHKEGARIDVLVNMLINGKRDSTVTWAIQRIWIDESLSDNAKCYMIFTIGRFYAQTHMKGGENYDRN